MSFLLKSGQLTISENESHVANRLVSALVRSWDHIPITTQVRLLNEAMLFPNRAGEEGSRSGRVMHFIEKHKNGHN